MEVNKMPGRELVRLVKTKIATPVRKERSDSSKFIVMIPKNSLLKTTYENAGWYKVTYQSKTGWIRQNKTTTIKTEKSNTTTTTVNGQTVGDAQNSSNNSSTDDATDTSSEDVLTEEERAAIYKEYSKYLEGYNSSNSGKVLLENFNGVFGMPYQFSSIVDPKGSGSTFGLKYMERMVTRAPLIIMSPGKVEYMPNSSKKEAAGVLNALIDTAAGAGEDIMSAITDHTRYYGFKYSYDEFYKYLNQLCRAGAVYLGIQDVKVNIGGNKNTALKNIKWEKTISNNFSNYISSRDSVAFYVDGVNQINDSFSNSSMESQLVSKVNSFSDVGKEIAFLLGSQAGVKFDLTNNELLNEAQQGIEDLADKYLKGNQLFKNLSDEFTTIVSGGKLIFPELWEDSSFNRSFDINIKLRSPDADVLSWYLNIYVPMCFLICFVAPQQKNKWGYYTPFLVRASYKGLFNIDMGLVTELSFGKGQEGFWTIDGLPTVVDVSISIKDLYQSVLSITEQNDNWFMNNTVLMDYIANLCGVNINKPDIARTLDVYLMLKTNRITDIPNKLYNKLEASRTNMLMSFYQKGISLLK